MVSADIRLKAQVWVFSGTRVLLLRTRPERGDFWQPITGSVEPGESPAQGAIRELREETGIAVLDSGLIDVGHEFEFDSRWGGRSREHVWAVSLRDGEPEVRMDPAEHVAFVWVEFGQAEKMLLHESAKKCLFLAKKCVDKKN
jgi:8-oxo-dGTP pyrophosphatase MutT (NUDIX family)